MRHTHIQFLCTLLLLPLAATLAACGSELLLPIIEGAPATPAPTNTLVTSFASIPDRSPSIATAAAPVLLADNKPAIDEIPWCLSSQGQPLENVQRLVMPTIDNQSLITADLANSSWGPTRIAVRHNVFITPDRYGSWETLDDGGTLWRLRIYSAGAAHLSLGFTRFALDFGCLFIYPPSRKLVLGPYRQAGGQLWTPSILGDELVLEVTLAPGMMDDLLLRHPEYFQLELTHINHGYVGLGLNPNHIRNQFFDRLRLTQQSP